MLHGRLVSMTTMSRQPPPYGRRWPLAVHCPFVFVFDIGTSERGRMEKEGFLRWKHSVKLRSPRNTSEASQPNSVAAFFPLHSTEVDGDLF